MKREGDVIRFDDDEGDVQHAFEQDIAESVGADIFIQRLFGAFAAAGEGRDRAWKRMLTRARGAGLITQDERLTWHRDGEKFTVSVDKARPASRRHLQDILAELETAKREAVSEKLFNKAALILDAVESLRRGLRLAAEADTQTDVARDTTTTDDKSEDAETK